MLLDVFKAVLACSLPYSFSLINFETPINQIQLINFQLMTGVSCVLGHIFPIFFKFRGGKGVACILGMMLAIHFQLAISCLILFIIILIVSKYVSLGSMLASLAFPLFLLLLNPYKLENTKANNTLIVFGSIVFLMILITHQKNIKRLIHGEENKTNLIRKRKDL